MDICHFISHPALRHFRNGDDLLFDYLYHVQVYAGVRYCGDVKYEVGKSVYSVECDGAVAEFVQIEQDNDYLTLCEVQVYGKPSDDLAWQNIAIGKLEFNIAYRTSSPHITRY